MSCHGGTYNKSSHVTLSQTWSPSGTLKPSSWYPFGAEMNMPHMESYCGAGCPNPTNFTSGSTSWTRGGNVTPDTAFRRSHLACQSKQSTVSRKCHF